MKHFIQDSFFKYIEDNRQAISKHLYGFSTNEKKYDSFMYTSLPEALSITTSLESALRSRATVRNYKQSALKLEKVAYILKMSIAQDKLNSGLKGYSFPSGGALYPIESYLLSFNIEGTKSGLYHYSAVEHSICLIKEREIMDTRNLNLLFGAAFESVPAGILLMTMNKNRCIKKYGSLSYVLTLIEAGHRGQNLCLTSAAQNLGVCPLGGGDYMEINKLLEIDGNNEHHIYAVAFGEKVD